MLHSDAPQPRASTDPHGPGASSPLQPPLPVSTVRRQQNDIIARYPRDCPLILDLIYNFAATGVAFSGELISLSAYLTKY